MITQFAGALSVVRNPRRTIILGALLSHMLLVSTGSVWAIVPSERGLAPSLEDEFQEVIHRHDDAPEIKSFLDRLAMVDEVARHIDVRLDAIRRRAAEDLMREVVRLPGKGGKVPEEPPSGMLCALEIIAKYSPAFAEALQVLPFSEQELCLLRQYYAAAVKSAADRIIDQGGAIVAEDLGSKQEVLTLCLVIPLLHTPDECWSQNDIETLATWMRQPETLQICEDFALSAGRPFTAYQFALHRQRLSGNDGEEPSYAEYVIKAAERLEAIQELTTAITCVKIAIEAVAKEGLGNRLADLRIKLAELYSLAGHPALGAAECKQVLESETDLYQRGYLLFLRAKYLYDAKLYETIVHEYAHYQFDSTDATYVPETLYIIWVAHRKADSRDRADELKANFLKRFPDSILAADMYFSDAMSAMAHGKYDEAVRLLEIIEQRFPGSRILDKAKGIKVRLQRNRKREEIASDP